MRNVLVEPAIEISAVSKRLGGRSVLAGVNVAVPPGALYGLVGLNGAGKTTTLRIALGLLRPDSGSSSVLGLSSSRLATRPGRIGVAMHGVGLDAQLTAVDNLRLHALLHGRRGVDCEASLDRLGLLPLAKRRAARLSQGERQRLSLARALLLQPDVLILDEPLTHLDPGAVEDVLRVLREEIDSRGVSVLLSSHQLEHVERASDSLALLHSGQVLLDGSMDELLEDVATTILVEVDSVDRAEQILDGESLAKSVERIDVSGNGAGRLRVMLADCRPEELNARLNQQGVRISLLTPERRTLHELFRDAVRMAEQDGGGA